MLLAQCLQNQVKLREALEFAKHAATGLRQAYGKDERGTIYATGVHESIKAELKQQSAK
jgi:hypothetical protein